MSEDLAKKITKFKFHDETVSVSYYEVNKNFPHQQEHTITTKDRPIPALEMALANLDSFVIKICELPEDATVIVTGFSLKWNKDEDDSEYIANCIITSVRKLQHGSGGYALNSPQRFEKNSEDESTFPEGMAASMNQLIYYVNRFLNGERIGKTEDLFEQADEKNIIMAKYGVDPKGFKGYIHHEFREPLVDGMRAYGLNPDEYLCIEVQSKTKNIPQKIRNFENYIGTEFDNDDVTKHHYFFIPVKEIDYQKAEPAAETIEDDEQSED